MRLRLLKAIEAALFPGMALGVPNVVSLEAAKINRLYLFDPQVFHIVNESNLGLGGPPPRRDGTGQVRERCFETLHPAIFGKLYNPALTPRARLTMGLKLSTADAFSDGPLGNVEA